MSSVPRLAKAGLAGEGVLSDLNPNPPRDNRSFEAPFPDRLYAVRN